MTAAAASLAKRGPHTAASYDAHSMSELLDGYASCSLDDRLVVQNYQVGCKWLVTQLPSGYNFLLIYGDDEYVHTAVLVPRTYMEQHPHISVEFAAHTAGYFLPDALLHVSRLRLLGEDFRG